MVSFFYRNLNASHLPYFGSNWNNGTQTGTFNLHVNNSTTNTNSNIASHLLILCLIKSIYFGHYMPDQHGRIHYFQKTVLVGLFLQPRKLGYKSQRMCYMKRYGHIFYKIATLENIEMAHKCARKDKTHYNEVQMVDENKEYYFKEIQDMLINKTYAISPDDYKMFIKNDKGKEREIYKLDYFPHRIIQWALILQIEEMLHKHLVANTFSSIPERGIHLALKKMDKDIQGDKAGTKYCLKMDVKKFYPSINQEIAKSLFRLKFKDSDLLWLIDTIIDSMGGGTGIAIGSLFSQWVGNFYLSFFDHWLKEVKGVRYYYRYCDDIVILHENKDFLHELCNSIKEYLENNLKLEIKGDYQIFPRGIRGIDFVGYRHFGDYILLRKTTAKNLKSNMTKLLKRCDKGTQMTYGEWCSVNSYKGWLKWCNAHNLYRSHIKPLEPYCDKYYREVIKGENISKC